MHRGKDGWQKEPVTVYRARLDLAAAIALLEFMREPDPADALELLRGLFGFEDEEGGAEPELPRWLQQLNDEDPTWLDETKRRLGMR